MQIVLYCIVFRLMLLLEINFILSYLILCLYHTEYKHRDELVTQRQVRLLNQGSSSSRVHIEDAC